MIENIIIGTTATNRYELHNLVIHKWNSFFEKLIEKYNIKICWFINIDIVKIFDDDYDINKIKSFFEKTINKNIQIIFMDENTKPSLFRACKTLYLSIDDYVEKKNINKNKTLLCWLEDDWDVNLDLLNDDLIYILFNLNFEKNFYINLTCIDKNYLGILAPSFMSYIFWKKYHYPAIIIEENENICPERCIQIYISNILQSYNSKIITLNYIISSQVSRREIYHNNEENKFYYFSDCNSKLIKFVSRNGFKVIENLDQLLFSDENFNICFIRILPKISIDIGVEHRIKNNIEKIYTGKKKFVNFYYEKK